MNTSWKFSLLSVLILIILTLSPGARPGPEAARATAAPAHRGTGEVMAWDTYISAPSPLHRTALHRHPLVIIIIIVAIIAKKRKEKPSTAGSSRRETGT